MLQHTLDLTAAYVSEHYTRAQQLICELKELSVTIAAQIELGHTIANANGSDISYVEDSANMSTDEAEFYSRSIDGKLDFLEPQENKIIVSARRGEDLYSINAAEMTIVLSLRAGTHKVISQSKAKSPKNKSKLKDSLKKV